MAYQDRRAKAEQLELMRERVAQAVSAMAQWDAYVEAAIEKAKVSLEDFRKALARAKA